VKRYQRYMGYSALSGVSQRDELLEGFATTPPKYPDMVRRDEASDKVKVLF